jgi:hypothetical protein
MLGFASFGVGMDVVLEKLSLKYQFLAFFWFLGWLAW